MRLAFVSPLPPSPTGVADYACDVLRPEVLGGSDVTGAPPDLVEGSDSNGRQHPPLSRHPNQADPVVGRGAEQPARPSTIDVFHAQGAVDLTRLPPVCRLFRAAEMLARHAAEPYDLVIYQLGNSPEHAFVYDLLPRLPGLVVLHDLVLHHARARHFLESPAARAYAADPSRADLRDAARRDLDAYREELAYTYPRQAERLYDAQLETAGALLPYAYPLCRLPLECARAIAVHNDFMADATRGEVPGTPVVRVPMPMRALAVSAHDVAAVRARHGLDPGDFVVGTFGLLTAEKRLDTLARAVARAASALPRLRLLLVGPVPGDGAGVAALRARLDALGVGTRAVITGRVPLDELPAHMGAADLAVHLRYPTGRETSAALLRLLAQGRPVVMSDLEHQADVPADAVVRADVADEEGEVTRAILRLAERPDLRAALGASAARFVAREHSFERAREGYDAAIRAALAQAPPRPRPDWPAHWRAAAAR